MVQPINYLGGAGGMQATNPFQSLAQGIQTGMSIRAMRDQREMRELQKQQLRDSMAQEALTRERMDSFRAAMSEGRGVEAMLNEFPEQAGLIMKIHGFNDERDLKQTRQDLAELTGAMTLGEEATRNYFEDQRKAYQNAGNAEGVAQIDRAEQAYIQNPKRFAQSINRKHQMLFPDDAFKISSASKMDEETKHLGTKATASKLAAEATKLTADLKAAAAAGATKGKVDPEKRPDFELKLRNQYLKETDEFQKVATAYDRVTAAEETGAGDVALIFNYMKMLDPGSVVREGEFATAENTSGVPDKLRNTYNKLMEGKRLSPEQRKNFRSQAENMFKAAKPKEKRVRDRISRQAGNYGLNIDNIFLKDTARIPGSQPEVPATLTLPSGRQLDMSKLTPEQQQKVMERYGRSK